MERLAGRVAVVTGAASGIGRTLATALARNGMKVAAIDKMFDTLQTLEKDCEQLKGELKVYKCDLTIDADIELTIESIVKDFGPVSVLINNAAISVPVKLTDTSTGSCRKIYETNVIGLVSITQHVVELMKKNDITDGHIININSLVGHCVYPKTGSANYCASKNAVTVLTQCLRNELSELNFNTRVTSISPSLVDTFMGAKYGDDFTKLSTENIVECILFVLQLNKNINISEIIVEPVKEVLLNFIDKRK